MANWRIQQAMEQLQECIHQSDNNDTTTNTTTTNVLVSNLTSVTFVTSWNPSLDCCVTLHYHAPLLNTAAAWVQAAQKVATQCGWQQLTGRSKGQVLRAVPDKAGELFIHDTVYLQQQQQQPGQASHEWKVSLEKADLSASLPIINVLYVKPESAFGHPNPQVMCQALAWLLNRITAIAEHNNNNNNNQPSLVLMELYCGCGAHTMALVQSGLLTRVVAVELDERLVQACRRNAILNHCQDKVEIVAQDAGTWSSSSSSLSLSNPPLSSGASILLVDPPRQGLDARVCQMAATTTNLQHVLYISCGREALARDLQILKHSFEIVDCVLLDLFPQTFSVESLVHLRRRQS
jgi:23S rRNA (uracil1939-C5)-methyltransferase